ncbi:MAG: ABC transporter ATP-binding protein [Halobacteriaceae archaeon]
MPVVEANGVTKRYGEAVALGGLDLAVDAGEIHGLVGPNGSGKTTALHAVLGYARPTAGTVRVFGDPPGAHAERVGVVPEGYGVWERFTGAEHVAFAAAAAGPGGDASPDGGSAGEPGVDAATTDPAAFLERVGLRGAADRRAGGYSAGMVKRLILAMALAGDPDLLVLDEPFAGVDPLAALAVRRVLRAERSRGTTVLFSTHDFGHAEAVCDRVGLLRDGRLVAERSGHTGGPTARLGLAVRGDVDAARAAAAGVRGVESVRVADRTDGRLVARCVPSAELSVLVAIADHPDVASASLDDPSLEAAFVEHVRGEAGSPT